MPIFKNIPRAETKRGRYISEFWNGIGKLPNMDI